jgi:hypothetical protein
MLLLIDKKLRARKALAKEVIVQPSEVIARIKKLIGE